MTGSSGGVTLRRAPPSTAERWPPAVSKRDGDNQVTDSVDFVPESDDSVEADTTTAALVALMGYLDVNDFEGFFGYLNSLGSQLEPLIAKFDADSSLGVGDSLDVLAERYPAHFVGWLDSVAAADVQQALMTRPRLAMVIAAQREQPAEW